MKEGKLQFSKDADPSQSGVVGENYLLYSKEGKLLMSIPLEKLKRNTRKVSNTGKGSNGCGCLLKTVFVIVVLSVISNITIPKFPHETERRRSLAAKYTLLRIGGCASETADEVKGTTIIPELTGYKSKKKNIAGFYLENNRKLSGTSIICPTTGEIKLVSENERKYPTLSYDVGTGKKTCIADSGSIAEKMSCKNGEW